MRIEELRCREVINTCTCRKLGFVGDIEFDICTGNVCALIVFKEGKYCGVLGRECEFRIPFCDVVQFGKDIILVRIKEEDCMRKCKSSFLNWLKQPL